MPFLLLLLAILLSLAFLVTVHNRDTLSAPLPYAPLVFRPATPAPRLDRDLAAVTARKVTGRAMNRIARLNRHERNAATVAKLKAACKVGNAIAALSHTADEATLRSLVALGNSLLSDARSLNATAA